VKTFLPVNTSTFFSYVSPRCVRVLHAQYFLSGRLHIVSPLSKYSNTRRGKNSICPLKRMHDRNWSAR